MYDDTVKRIRSGQEKERGDLAMKTLMLLSYTLQPLTLGEVQHALLAMEVEPNETTIDPDDVYGEELLVAICAGIAVIEDRTSAFRFVHHTAETYFESNRESLFNNGHIELTKICVTYLSFDEFNSGPCQTDEELKKRLRLYQLYNYAAHNWGHHARKASILYSAVIEFLEHRPKIEASSQALIVELSDWRSNSQEFPRQMTGLHLAAYFGIEEAVKNLLQERVESDTKDSWSHTPLSWAAENGHEAVVKQLLEAKADVESKDDSGQTPLSWAAANGHEAVVKLLQSTTSSS
jgi:hypothetical protein